MDWKQTLHHDGSARYATQNGGSATLRVRADRDAPIEQIFVRTAPDGEQRLTPLRRIADQPPCQWWEIDLPRSMPRDGYRLYLITSEGTFWFSAAGLTRYTPTDATDFKLLAETTLPDWVPEAVFYQIFPDRFADGDPNNNVQNGHYLYRDKPVVARNWEDLPTPGMGHREFFGGDLQGIIEKLPYIEAIGVTALYLTPIFTSPSSHKYDSQTYEEVDPHFGGNQALADLRAALDQRGMRLMLDLVPNHAGSLHHWFKTAQADANAPEAEYFTFHHYPDDYESWLGVPTLPKLNYRSERLRQVMYSGDDSIVRRWMRSPYRIDGWRIDVANMLARQGEHQLGHKIGRGLRRAVKSENPQAYLLGENFYDGTPHLQGEELDACMNYRGFGFPVLQWLAGDYYQGKEKYGLSALDTATMAAQWQAFLSAIPWQIALRQFNVLGSHDTPRVATILNGDMARLQIARVLLHTFPGAPCIYYGDEIGLEGSDDPDNRRAMPWDESRWNHELLAFERTLTALRRESPALRCGGFQLLHAAEETVAFLRDAPEEALVVVARRAADTTSAINARAAGLADGCVLHDVLSKETITIENGQLALASLPATGVQLWRFRREE